MHRSHSQGAGPRCSARRFAHRAPLALLLCVVGTLLVGAAPAGAAPGDLVWARDDLPRGSTAAWHTEIALAAHGDIFVVSQVMDGLAPFNTRLAVSRYTSRGTLKWMRTYRRPGSSTNLPVAVGTDRFDNLYIAGLTIAPSSHEKWLILKYSGSGVRGWVHVVDGGMGGSDFPTDAVADPRGGFYVTGVVERSAANLDWQTAKYLPDGRRAWRTTRGTLGGDIARGIARDAAGNLYVTGSDADIAGGVRAVTLSYTPKGKMRWLQSFGVPPIADEPLDIAVSAGGVAVAGRTGIGAGYDGLVLSYARDGAFRWSAVYTGFGSPTGDDVFETVGIDAAGRVFPAGRISLYPVGSDFVVMKCSSSGGFEGSYAFASDPGYEVGASDLVCTPDGSLFVTGALAEATRASDVQTVAMSPDFSWRWDCLYDPDGGNDHGDCVRVTSSYVYVGGVSTRGVLLLKYRR
jgi:hypothetical protein